MKIELKILLEIEWWDKWNKEKPIPEDHQKQLQDYAEQFAFRMDADGVSEGTLLQLINGIHYEGTFKIVRNPEDKNYDRLRAIIARINGEHDHPTVKGREFTMNIRRDIYDIAREAFPEWDE